MLIVDQKIKNDTKALTNPKHFDDVVKNIPECMIHYNNSKKSHSSTKYSGNDEFKRQHEKLDSESKSGCLKGSNNNLLVKSKTGLISTVYDTKKIIQSSIDKTKQILNVFHSSSEKKVFQKIK